MNLSLSKTSRSRILLWGLLVIGAIFIVRLFWLQVVQHDYYVAKARESQVTKFTILPKRGVIYAKDGDIPVPLVMNEPVYTIYADPSEVEDANKVESVMRRVAGGDMREDFRGDLDNKKLRYTVLAKQVTKKQAELIKAEELLGVGQQENTRRVYPEGQLGGQLLGYVNSDGQGQYGLEGALNDQLKGRAGELKTVTDVRQIPLSISDEYIRLQAQDGDNVVLNVDRNIQAYVEEALEKGLKNARATKGSVIVMDPNTGGVMAMANYPTYDPSKYYEVEDFNLFQNNVVAAPYETGSVIKTLTMGIGLDTGAVTRDTTFNNTGFVYVDGIEMSNVEEDPIDPAATMTDVLHYSLNTGVVYILEQMGDGSVNQQSREMLHSYFTKNFLFGKKTGIEQANEQPGTVIGPNEGDGRNVRYANMSFGQGMDLTMVQTAAAFSAAINGGTYYKPQLVGGTLNDDGTIAEKAPEVVRENVLREDSSATLRDMVYEARQLGFFGGSDKPGYIVGGKTGTSQIIDPKTGEYTDDNSIGSYLGFGGGTKPEYVIMVRVEDSQLPGYAGTVAAGPIFGDISNWMLEYLQVQPAR